MLRSLRCKSFFDYFFFLLILSGVFILFALVHLNIYSRVTTDSVLNIKYHSKTVTQLTVKSILYNNNVTKVKHEFTSQPNVSFAWRLNGITTRLIKQPIHAQHDSKVSTAKAVTATKTINSTVSSLKEIANRHGNRQLNTYSALEKKPASARISKNNMKMNKNKFDHDFEKPFTKVNNIIISRTQNKRSESSLPKLNGNIVPLLRGFRNTFNDKFFKVRLRKSGSTSNQNEVDKNTPERNDTCEACFENNFPVLLNQENLCKDKSGIDLLILISSAPTEKEQRKAIRETWGSKCNHANSTIRCLFIIGNIRKLPTSNNSMQVQKRSNIKTYDQHLLKKESLLHNDIVQFDFIDSYGNLTYKTLSGFKWAADFCAAAKYVMKTDTDMYINTYLLPYLLKEAPSKLFMGGYCWGMSPPNRDVSSKWFVSYKRYKHKSFPPMCSGTGYILSADALRIVLEKSHNIPFFHLEDVYLSLCLKNTSIRPRRLAGFSNMREHYGACNFKTEVFTSHYMYPDLLYKIWDEIESCDSEIPDSVYEEIEYPFI